MFLGNSFFIRGLLIGFLTSVPVGPIALVCIRRALAKGFMSGFASGLGAATADGLYALIALYGLSFISAPLITYRHFLQFFGGFFLIYLGYSIYKTPTMTDGRVKKKTNFIADYLSTFLLTITNPITIFAFAAFFAGLGVGYYSPLEACFLIAGVSCGATLWWLFLTSVAGLFRSRFNSNSLQMLNKISGVGIAFFGLATLLVGLLALK